jgi:Protein of unknown function (DUF2934)
MQDLEQSIRERAYQLWIEAGCEDGQADAHWLAAQREILSASLGAIDPEQRAAEKPVKPKAKATRKKRVA